MSVGSFRFWQREEMIENQDELDFMNLVRILNSAAADTPKTGVIYFGSPYSYLKLQTTVNAGVASVEIFPVINLRQIERSTEYTVALGGCNDYTIGNGYTYRLITAGTTAGTAPAYSTTLGDTVTDGSAVFRCVAAAHKTTEVKLALIEADLQNAIAGAGVQLGATVNGGSPIPIYYQITDSVNTVFDDTRCPQLCFAVNDCTESQKEENNQQPAP